MSNATPIYQISRYNSTIREKNPPYGAAKEAPSTRKRNKLKLDQIMQRLFKLSDKVTIQLINGLFNENFACETVTLHYVNSKFINNVYDRIEGDLYITVKTKDQTFEYHIEFQTLNDETILIRMFRYGFEKAIELAKHAEMKGPMILTFPRQLVIFLEKNEAISDKMSFIVKLPDGAEIHYSVPVVKYWTFSTEELVVRRMYALLPLQVFKFRKTMKTIEQSGKTDLEKHSLKAKQFKLLEQTIQCIIANLGKLKSEEINMKELDEIMTAMQHLTDYLYNHYSEYDIFEREVNEMIKTFIDPLILEKGMEKGMKEGMKEGKAEMIRSMMQNGISVTQISEMISSSVEEIELLLK